ncbi:hypothetical protein BOH78_1339, partial [Pichia kudriavzevii]
TPSVGQRYLGNSLGKEDAPLSLYP